MNAPPAGDIRAATARAEADALRARKPLLDDDSIDVVLRKARSHHTWLARPVDDESIREIYDVARWGATSTNGNPARFVFVRSSESKNRLAACVNEGNVAKILAAPVTAIIGHDLEWWRGLPRLFPHKDMSGPYRADPEKAADTAFRNGTLQGAYLMVACRALGFDVGAMSGFDNARIDAEFFSGSTIRSNFLCCFGYADTRGLFGRLPRYEFDEVCRFD